MWDILRDSAIGQVLRFLSFRKGLLYPEEEAEFEVPSVYAIGLLNYEKRPNGGAFPDDKAGPKDDEEAATPKGLEESGTESREDPLSTKEKTTLVTWYSETDPSNPQNWSITKKHSIALQINIIAFVVYAGSSIYGPVVPNIMSEFNVGDVSALLGLALYILAYGIAPMILSPLSEIPRLGRMGIYVVTFAIFVILNVSTSLVQNFAGLLVLRFLLGFFGSPALATGVAILSDMYSPLTVGYAISLWGASITLGPALGPVISGFAVQAKGWRWSSWELLWMSGPVLVAMIFFLPETSADAILMQRARRLRRITGRTDLKSQSEIDQANMSARQVLVDALIKPFEINALDPSVLFTTFHVMLIYGILYSFFESFPIVYTEMYGLNLGETSLLFLCICVALALAVPAYMGYLYFVAIPAMQTQPGFGSPEARLLPGVIRSFLVSIGLFIFAWTACRSINYFVSLFGVLLSFAGVFPIIQSMFLYLAFTYPTYAASLFAANDFARSTFAAGAVLFSTPMYDRLGIDGGVSLLAGLTVLCIVGMLVLYFFGANLRARSRFAVKPNL